MVTQRATSTSLLENKRSYAYWYDALNRLIDARMGTLAFGANGRYLVADGSGGAPVPPTTHWKLDNLGNWAGGSVAGGVIVTPSVERLADWNNNGLADDFPEKTHHAVDNANEIAVLYQESGNPPTGTPTALVYDSAGNLVYDGRYVFQYDAFNRLVQVNERGDAQFDEYGRAYLPQPVVSPPPPVLGDLICRYVYDGVGRLISKATPINTGQTNLQTKDFYYDGVRRIQERITRPGQMLHDYTPGTFVTEGGGTPASDGVVENDELALKRADGEKPQQQIVEPNIIVPLNEIWTDRAYIYGPEYVDEFVAQIDRYGNVMYMLQDANYNVVALVSGGGPGTPQPGGGTLPFQPAGYVLEQYTYDPYGSIVAAENFDLDGTGKSLHAVNRVGHQGLFFERFDGSYIDQTLAEGGLPSQLATARATGLYYNRNRFYHPQLGRFMTRDPNETGLPIIAALATNGEVPAVVLSGFDAPSLYEDGVNIYQYERSNPNNSTDALGLMWRPGDNHLYPKFLGGAPKGPGSHEVGVNHLAFHRQIFADLDLPYGKWEEARAKWIKKDVIERKMILKKAATAAGIDVTDSIFEHALDKAYDMANHGTNQSGLSGKAELFEFRRLPQGKARALAPHSNNARNIGIAVSVVGAAITAYSIYEALQIDNPYLQDLAMTTIKLRRSGEITMLDEVSAYYDLYMLTNNPTAAAWGWRYWANQNGMNW